MKLVGYKLNINSEFMASKTFGRRMADWREKANLTQAGLARRLEVSPTYISTLERDYSASAKSGKPQPSREFVDKLARALGVPLEEARVAAGYAPPPQNTPSEAELQQIQSLFFKGDTFTGDRKVKYEVYKEIFADAVKKLEAEERLIAAGKQSPARAGKK